jgi:hypothetical protein
VVRLDVGKHQKLVDQILDLLFIRRDGPHKLACANESQSAVMK